MYDTLTLIKSARSQDSQSRLLLIRQYTPLLYSMGQKYNLNNLPPEDLISEGIVVLLMTINDYDPSLKVPFGAYLKKQLFYHWVEKAKKFRYTSSLDEIKPDSEGLTLLESLCDPDLLIESRYSTQELLKTLSELLKKLRPRQVWLLNEVYARGRSLNELAQEAGCSANALSQMHRRLLKQLRAELCDAGFSHRPN
ncbi:sigma-70 family RNA polymerase sigma factor [Eubacteriaceae bacterium ES3]|nr:sigma-70 family RNA polymerase sigma factor [Eubacteriaceae bacterium ES3]